MPGICQGMLWGLAPVEGLAEGEDRFRVSLSEGPSRHQEALKLSWKELGFCTPMSTIHWKDLRPWRASPLQSRQVLSRGAWGRCSTAHSACERLMQVCVHMRV